MVFDFFKNKVITKETIIIRLCVKRTNLLRISQLLCAVICELVNTDKVTCSLI